MSQVKSTFIEFEPSDSPDVIGYALYVEEAPNLVSYESPRWELGDTTSVDVSTLDDMTTRDGVYNLGVTAIDDAGNESSMSRIDNVPFDFVAPNPPGVVTVRRL